MSKIVHLLVPAVIVITGMGGYYLLASSREPPARTASAEPPPLVETVAVERAPASFEIATNGTVVPKREIALAAEVSGRVVKQASNLLAGRFVTAGSFLLQIDRRPYDLEIKRLESEKAQADADLVQIDVEKVNNTELIAIAEADLSIEQRESDRLDRLASRNAASDSERDQATSELMRAKNALQTLKNNQRVLAARAERLKAQLDLIDARLELAQLDLDKTTITAPVDGIIAEEFIEEHVFVQPGTILLKIEDKSAVEVKCNIRVEDLQWLWSSVESKSAGNVWEQLLQAPRVPATVRYTVGAKTYEWSGFLSRYEGVGIDPVTRTVPCRVEVPEPIREDDSGALPALVRGMFVSVALVATPRVPLLQVPAPALRPGNEIWCVAGGKLEIRAVQVARVFADKVLLRSGPDGPEADLEVVVSPIAAPQDGMPVRVQGEL